MAVMADKLRKVVIPVHKRDIPGPIHYMPQRTRRPWRIIRQVVVVATAVMWGIAFFLAGLAVGLYLL